MGQRTHAPPSEQILDLHGQLLERYAVLPLELAFWLLSKMPGRDINKTIAKLPAVWRSRSEKFFLGGRTLHMKSCRRGPNLP